MWCDGLVYLRVLSIQCTKGEEEGSLEDEKDDTYAPSDGTDSAFPALRESSVSVGFQKLAQEPSALRF